MSLHGISDEGLGRPAGVLLIQAPGDAGARLSGIAAGLERAGFAVRCLKPAVRCQDGRTATRWQDWHASAEAALADMRKDCDVVIAGGLSTGAALGLLLAADHPEDVQATAHFAPTVWLDGGLAPWAAGLVCTLLGRRMAEAIGISPWLSRKLGVSREVLAEHRRLLEAARRALGRISQPALIIHSREDRCAGLDNAGYLQRHLKGLVEMAVPSGSQGAESLDRQHGFVVEKVQRFIEGIVRRPRRAVAAVRAVQAA